MRYTEVPGAFQCMFNRLFQIWRRPAQRHISSIIGNSVLPVTTCALVCTFPPNATVTAITAYVPRLPRRVYYTRGCCSPFSKLPRP